MLTFASTYEDVKFIFGIDITKKVVYIADNVLQLKEVGDFGDENSLPQLNLIRGTNLHLATEPPISCRCCKAVVFYLFNHQLKCLFNVSENI